MSKNSEAIHNLFKDALTYGAPRKYARVTYQPEPYDPQKLVKFPISVWKPLRANYDDFVTKAIETLPSKGFIDQTLIQLSGTKKRAYIDNLSHTGYTIKDEPMSSYSPYHKMPQANAKNVQQRVEEDNEYYSLTHKSWQKSYKDTDGKVNSWVGAADDAYTQQILKEYKISNGLITSNAPKTLFTTDDRFFSEVETNKKIKSKLENLQITIEELKRKNNTSPARFGTELVASQNAFNTSKKRLDDQLALYENTIDKKTTDEKEYMDAIADYNKLQKDLEKATSDYLPANIAMKALSSGGLTKIVDDLTKRADTLTLITDAKNRLKTAEAKAALDAIPIEFVDKLKAYEEKEVESGMKTITADPVADKKAYDAEVAKIEADANASAVIQVNAEHKVTVGLITDLEIEIPKLVAATRANLATTNKDITDKHKEFTDAYASFTAQSENLKKHPELIKRYQIEHQETYNKLKSSEIDAAFFLQLKAEEKKVADQKAKQKRNEMVDAQLKTALEKKEIATKEMEENRRKAEEEKRYADLLTSTIAPFSSAINRTIKTADTKREIESQLIAKSLHNLLSTSVKTGDLTALAIDEMKREITGVLRNTNLPSASSNFPSGSTLFSTPSSSLPSGSTLLSTPSSSLPSGSTSPTSSTQAVSPPPQRRASLRLQSQAEKKTPGQNRAASRFQSAADKLAADRLAADKLAADRLADKQKLSEKQKQLRYTRRSSISNPATKTL